MSTVESAKRQTKEVIERSLPWIEPLARMGYVAKGIVYLMIAVMATRFALGKQKQPGDFNTVLLKLFSEPFGRVLLALLTIGLIGYGVWCLIQAVMDTEKKGTSLPGIFARVFFAGVAVVYLVIAWDAMLLLTNTSTVKQGDESKRHFTAELFAISSSTRWIAIAAGLGFLGFFIYEIRRLYVEGIEILRPQGSKGLIDVVGVHIGQIGIAARAFLFAVIGVYLAWSGITLDPNKVRGISGALTELRRQSQGTYLLIATAFGLGAYGIFMLLLAWRRRIEPT